MAGGGAGFTPYGEVFPRGRPHGGYVPPATRLRGVPPRVPPKGHHIMDQVDAPVPALAARASGYDSYKGEMSILLEIVKMGGFSNEGASGGDARRSEVR
jgi:hypothetical protein